MTTPLNSIDTLLRRIDGYQRRSKRAGFLYGVFKKYSEDEAGHKAALLAYYGFLAVFPLLLVLTTILKLLLHNDSQLSGQIIRGAVDYFPLIGHDLQQNIHGIGKTGVALVVGILLTLFATRGVADVLRSGLDHIWQVPYVKRSGGLGSIFRSMSMIVVGGLGLLAAPLLSGYAVAFGQGFFFRGVSILLTLGILFVVLVFIIKMGTSTYRPLREIWVGALVAAISLEVLQALGGYILARELRNLDNLYGAFALVLGLLYWIYLQAQILFYAFEIDAVRIYKLWPRSLQKPLTPADHEAFALYAERARFLDPEHTTAN